MTTFLSNRSAYESVVCSLVPQARERLWIATADIKDMYVDTGGREPALVEPLVEQFDSVWKGDFCRECGRRKFCSDPAV